MNITGSEKLEKFCKKHSDAQSSIEKWVDEVTKASWKNHNVGTHSEYDSIDSAKIKVI